MIRDIIILLYYFKLYPKKSSILFDDKRCYNFDITSRTEEYYGQLLNVPPVHMYTIQNIAKLMSHTEECNGQLVTQN